MWFWIIVIAVFVLFSAALIKLRGGHGGGGDSLGDGGRAAVNKATAEAYGRNNHGGGPHGGIGGPMG